MSSTKLCGLCSVFFSPSPCMSFSALPWFAQLVESWKGLLYISDVYLRLVEDRFKQAGSMRVQSYNRRFGKGENFKGGKNDL